MIEDFPPHVQREVQSILDGVARRVLMEELSARPSAQTPMPESARRAGLETFRTVERDETYETKDDH
jgi:hypothetical protein